MARLLKSSLKGKRKGSRNMMADLKRKLERLDGESVQAGYFAEQGDHSTAEIPYTDLMYMHEHGQDGMPERPAMMYIAARLRAKESTTGIASQAAKNYITGKIRLRGFLNEYGREAYEVAQEVFGNPSILQVTFNPTPLVDTGELADKFSWKTSKNDTLQTMKRRKSVKFVQQQRKRNR